MSQRKAGILLNYLNEAIRILSALLYTPVMLRLLGQREYGLYQLAISLVSCLGLLNFGFGSGYMRFYSRYQEEDDTEAIARLNGMFLLVFTIMAVLCLLCGGVLMEHAELVFGSSLSPSELAKARGLFLILTVNLALSFLNSVFDCHIAARERFVFQKLLRTAQNLLNPFLTLPMLLMGHGSAAVVQVSLLLTVVVLAGNLIYCRRKLEMRFSFRRIPRSLLAEAAGFTFFVFLNQIIDQVNWNVDRLLLGRMCGTAATAVYGVAGQLNGMYLQISTAVSEVFAPKVNRIAARSCDEEALTRLMAQVGRIQSMILVLIASDFVFFGRAFLRLWAGEGYEDAYETALFLLLPVTVPLIQNLGIEIQRAKNKHRARSVVYALLAAGNVAISILLIPRWGSIGAAAGTAISIISGNILFMNWYYHKRIGLNMACFWKEISGLLPGWGLSFVLGAVMAQYPKNRGWVEFFLSAAAYTAAYGILLWNLGMNTCEKQMIHSIFRRK